MRAGNIAISGHAEAGMADRDFMIARAFDADNVAVLSSNDRLV